jgi:hypothetical protein
MRPVKHDKTGTIYLLIQSIQDIITNEWKMLYQDLDGFYFIMDIDKFNKQFSSINSNNVYHVDKKKITDHKVLIRIPMFISTLEKELDRLKAHKIVSVTQVDEWKSSKQEQVYQDYEVIYTTIEGA